MTQTNGRSLQVRRVEAPVGRAPLKLLVNFVFQRDEESCHVRSHH